MNTMMIPAEWVSKKLKLQTANKPKWLKNGYFTWVALVISIAVMLLSKKLLHIDLPILPFWLIISVLITIRYKAAVFHNLICPFAGLQKAFGRFSRFSQRVDKDACIGCKLCEEVCPSKAVVISLEDKKAAMNHALCYQCTNCRQVCPASAIYYGKHRG